MKPTKVFLISAFITALILVVIGGVTSIAMANKTAPQEPAPPVETVQTFQQREADYNKLIEQANQQLAESNAKLQAIQSQVNQAQANQGDVPASANTNVMTVSAEKAEQIACKAADPKSLLEKKPELVSFENKASYEVVFQNGSIYVDAQTGDVLFNGTIPHQINAEQASQIASDYLKNKDILLVDQITFRNAPLFRVIFNNGMIVYLDTTGQITYILKSTPKLADTQLQGTGGGGGSSGASFHEDNNHEGEDN
jgi:hypothetical protein